MWFAKRNGNADGYSKEARIREIRKDVGTIVRMKVSAGAIKQNRYVYVKYVPIFFFFHYILFHRSR